MYSQHTLEKQEFKLDGERGVSHLLDEPSFVGLQVHVHETILAEQMAS